MGYKLPQDEQAWLVGWSKWSSDRSKVSAFVGPSPRLSQATLAHGLHCWCGQKTTLLHSAGGVQALEGHCVSAYFLHGSVKWLSQTPPHIEGQPHGCCNVEEREHSLQQNWSSQNHTGFCPDVVAEPVQSDASHCSQVATHTATGHRVDQLHHGWEVQQETQSKG